MVTAALVVELDVGEAGAAVVVGWRRLGTADELEAGAVEGGSSFGLLVCSAAEALLDVELDVELFEEDDRDVEDEGLTREVDDEAWPALVLLLDESGGGGVVVVRVELLADGLDELEDEPDCKADFEAPVPVEDGRELEVVDEPDAEDEGSVELCVSVAAEAVVLESDAEDDVAGEDEVWPTPWLVLLSPVVDERLVLELDVDDDSVDEIVVVIGGRLVLPEELWSGRISTGGAAHPEAEQRT